MELFFNCSSSSKISSVRTTDKRLKELQYLILERDFDFWFRIFSEYSLIILILFYLKEIYNILNINDI